VLAALVAGGIYLATKDDGGGGQTISTVDTTSVETTDVGTTDVSSTEATDTTEVTDTTDATGVSEVSETTVAATSPPDTAAESTVADTEATTATTEEPATTEAPATTETPTSEAGPTTTTTPFVPPDGAIDLGHDVYLPIPDGWTQTNEPGQPAVISDGTTSVAAQALSRVIGEDITALVQEYTNTFDTVYGATGFGPTRFVRAIDGNLPINEYVTYYTTYDAGDPVGLSGVIFSFQRADGLSLVLDLYSALNSTSLPDPAFQTMVESLQHSPSLGLPAKLKRHDPFRVKSVTPVVAVEGLVGFSQAPGFNVVTPSAPGSPFTLVSNGGEDFSVIKVTAQSDTAAVIRSAQTTLQQSYANVEYDAATEDPLDQYNVIHGQFTWRGTYLDGRPSAGTIDFYFDTMSHNAFVAFRSWYTDTQPGEPAVAEAAFMVRSLYTSITTIP
jgi:hypothetical protein